MAHSDNLGLSRRPPVHKAVIPAHVCRSCAEKQKYLRRSGNSDSTLLICDSLLLQYDGVSVCVCDQMTGLWMKKMNGPSKEQVSIITLLLRRGADWEPAKLRSNFSTAASKAFRADGSQVDKSLNSPRFTALNCPHREDFRGFHLISPSLKLICCSQSSALSGSQLSVGEIKEEGLKNVKGVCSKHQLFSL